MKKQINQIIILFSISQTIIFLLSFLILKDISLLHYINISFYIGSIFIFLSLLIITVNSGFFDVVSNSFRLFFAGKSMTKKEVEEMRPLSKVITFNYSPIFMNGVLIIIFMLVALYIYSF